MTVRLKGVAVASESPTTNCKPAGSDWKFNCTAWGSSRTVLVSVRPLESVAVSLSSRYEGYSWSKCSERAASDAGVILNGMLVTALGHGAMVHDYRP